MKDRAPRRRPAEAAVEHTRGTHVPVLLDRILRILTPSLEGREAVCVDATLGLGGHTEALLQAFPQLTVVGLDRDPEAHRRSAERLAPFGDRFRPVHAVYDEFTSVLDRLGYERIDAALFDLGVSSLQLDEASRGFAYAQDAPLDMRMDPTRGRTAEDIVNEYSAGDLARILRVYGEEKFASRVAAAIVRERSRERLTSSSRLAELVRESIPAAARRTGGHPAKRTFQALRIEVNEELSALETALPAALDALRPGGRIAVLAYHSLEDRIVKRELVARSRSTSPLDLPVELPEGAAEFRLLTRGAEPPSEAEIAENPRSASAKLRAAERIRYSPGRGGRAGTGEDTT
ncbi:16S rRNA (cytosine(1402)-N(4))-methyltransferase RsmH [Longispora albida]|uniref:16S rRNA (cytosine(1402)-N(4))-methyltransferase RsmH n=1 Tax=Longispora albida TaxID=203523 RepID=UPI000374E169|nr:16S rRNA (cytosine(1402)-N(4))-methyltransferase RsmH [Longispora albida]